MPARAFNMSTKELARDQSTVRTGVWNRRQHGPPHRHFPSGIPLKADGKSLELPRHAESGPRGRRGGLRRSCWETKGTGTGPNTRRRTSSIFRLNGYPYGKPEKIAEAVVWPLYDEASFVTGHTLPVDGGTVNVEETNTDEKKENNYGRTNASACGRPRHRWL